MTDDAKAHQFAKPPDWDKYNPKINLDEDPENRLWLKQWDTDFSPDSPEARTWALREGYSAAGWAQSGLRAKWREQWAAKQQQEGGQ